MLEPEDHDPDVENRDDYKYQRHNDTLDENQLFVGCFSVEEWCGLRRDGTVSIRLQKILEIMKKWVIKTGKKIIIVLLHKKFKYNYCM